MFFANILPFFLSIFDDSFVPNKLEILNMDLNLWRFYQLYIIPN